MFGFFAEPVTLTGSILLAYQPRGKDPAFTLASDPVMPPSPDKHEAMSLKDGFGWDADCWDPLCGCAAYDVVVILRKSGQAVTGCDVKVTSERAETDPKVFTKIHMHFVVRGKGLKRNVVEHAIRLSHEKYCSASIMLGKTAEITKDFEIVEE